MGYVGGFLLAGFLLTIVYSLYGNSKTIPVEGTVLPQSFQKGVRISVLVGLTGQIGICTVSNSQIDRESNISRTWLEKAVIHLQNRHRCAYRILPERLQQSPSAFIVWALESPIDAFQPRTCIDLVFYLLGRENLKRSAG